MNDSSNGAERYIVVSADSHVGPPIEAYRPYCPKQFLEQFDQQVAAVQASRSTGGFAEVAAKALNYRDIDPRVVAAADRAIAVKGGDDPDARRQDMDESGVAAEVIFHGLQNGEPMPLVAEGLFGIVAAEGSPETDAAGCHMYNQWLVDFVAGAPERHAGLAQVSLLDIDGAVAEIEWAREAGLRGVNFPAPRRGRPDYTDERHDRFFAACADLALPLTTHTGGGDRWTYPDGTLALAFQHIEAPFVARRGIWQLIFSGVFDRHPSLKVVVTEVFAQWVPEMLRDMDAAYFDLVNPQIRGRIRRLPSEYWHTNCFVGASFMSRDEAGMYPNRGTENVMWGSDYPHLEGTHPYTRLALQTTFAGVPESAVRPMIGLTAAKVYGLDVPRLQQIADEIGPSVDELMAGPSGTPGEEYCGRAFRRSSSWPAGATAS